MPARSSFAPHPAAPLALLALALILTACDSGPTEPSVASIEVSAPTLVVELGETLQVGAELRDGTGSTVSGASPAWSSSDPGRASVNETGLVTGVGLGPVEIVARVGSVTGSLAIEVVGPAPEITSIAPEILRGGEDLFLTGNGFSPQVEQNRIRVGGRLAVVLEASETEVVARVPLDVCRPRGPVTVTASLGGSESEPVLHPFDATDAPPMEVGEFRLLAAPDRRCLLLPSSDEPEQYVVGAQSTSSVATSTVRLFVEGHRGGSTVAERSPAAGGPTLPFAAAAELRRPLDPLSRRMARHRRAEAEIRRGEARSLAPILAGGLSAAVSREVAGGSGAERDRAAAEVAAAVPGTVQPGDTVNLSVPDISAPNFCETGRDIRAVVRRVGSGSIWVEDTANPAGFTPQQFDELSDLYDDQILDELTEQFGEPTDLDDNDRIVVVISEAVNRMSDRALGFVVTVDFFPDQCPAGNGGEYYYARSPDPSGTIPGPDGPPDDPFPVEAAFEIAPTLLAHETTHTIQFGRRNLVPNAESFPSIWEREGQATLAEELVGLRVRGLEAGQNLGFQTAFTPPESERDWFSSGFRDLAIYYGFQGADSRLTEAPHECGWLAQDTDGPCDYGRLPYGVSWSFLRWLSDHIGPELPGGAPGLQQAMIDHPRTGFETVEDVTNSPIEPLLARWAATLYTDERLPPTADARLSFPNWNLRDIDEGLVRTARLRPTPRGFATFSDERRIAAGSTAYFLVEGGPRPDFALDLRLHTNAGLPDHVQLWVVRLQ